MVSHSALEEGIKLAQCGIGAFVAPSEASVLEVDFLEFTGMKHRPKAVNSARVDVPLVLIPGSVNLVKVPGNQPSHIRRWFVVEQLRKKSVFAGGISGAIDRSELEAGARSAYTERGRNTVCRGDKVGSIK